MYMADQVLCWHGDGKVWLQIVISECFLELSWQGSLVVRFGPNKDFPLASGSAQAKQFNC